MLTQIYDRCDFQIGFAETLVVRWPDGVREDVGPDNWLPAAVRMTLPALCLRSSVWLPQLES
jgi:hypothetical protein